MVSHIQKIKVNDAITSLFNLGWSRDYDNVYELEQYKISYEFYDHEFLGKIVVNLMLWYFLGLKSIYSNQEISVAQIHRYLITSMKSFMNKKWNYQIFKRFKNIEQHLNNFGRNSPYLYRLYVFTNFFSFYCVAWPMKTNPWNTFLFAQMYWKIQYISLSSIVKLRRKYDTS